MAGSVFRMERADALVILVRPCDGGGFTSVSASKLLRYYQALANLRVTSLM